MLFFDLQEEYLNSDFYTREELRDEWLYIDFLKSLAIKAKIYCRRSNDKIFFKKLIDFAIKNKMLLLYKPVYYGSYRYRFNTRIKNRGIE